MLFFMRGDVIAFLSLSCLPWALHLLGELLQLSYQALVGEAECLHFLHVSLHCFQCAGRSVDYIAWLVLHPWRIGVAPACVPS